MSDDLATSAASEARPGAAAGAAPAGPPGYELLDEVGRGGMGVVYRARDLALGRDVAVKLLALRYPLDSPAAQRFLGEARITGQLQHPGIPAVHQVGSLPDGRPFLAMKLIKGRTLEALLKDRPDASAERGRLLAVFEAVCQAVGYAHAHRVIHRDLKPANVMVGAFGEVQVMDWGLAKVLGEEGTAAAADLAEPGATRAWTEVRPMPEAGSHTEAGSLVGTPAFIPPEQAAGELAKVDERADVFGLGALLAVILTGKPPYVGEGFESVRVLALRGKLEDCLARLEGCGAEPELVSLCRQCLAFEPADRPRDAGEVAQAVARLRSAAEERARTAEREKAAADARSAEQRRKRQWQLAAAGVVAVALVGGLVGLGAYLRNLAAANQREKQAKAELETTLYFHRIALAHRELSQDNLGRARDLLKECPEELREWEWHYLMRLCRVEPVVLSDTTEVNSLAFHPDGERIAAACGDGTVKVWDLKAEQVVHTLRGHKAHVFSVAFRPPDGRYLASMSADRTLRVWDLTTEREVFRKVGHLGEYTGMAYAVTFSPDGRLLAAGSEDGSASLWDAADGREVRRLPEQHENTAVCVAFSPDGRLLATGSWGGVLRIWDARTGDLRRRVPGHYHRISTIVFHPDGRSLATASFDRSLKLWDAATGELLRTFRGHPGIIPGLAISPDGRRLASAGGEDKLVKIWDSLTGREILNLRGHTILCHCVAFSPDGRRLASCGGDGTIRIWDATPLRGNEGQESLTCEHDHEVWSVAFSPDGRHLASASWDKTVRLWDAQTGAQLLSLAHPSTVFRVAFSPDSKHLAAATIAPDRTAVVKVWDTLTGKEVFTIPRAKSTPFFVTFDPTGRYLLSEGPGFTVKVWDARTGDERGILGRHDQQIWCMTFSPDRKRLATASNDGKVRVWAWDPSRLGKLQEPEFFLPVRVLGYGERVAFSPDGLRLVTGGEEHTIKIWDAKTGRELETLRGHTGDVLAVALSPDRQWLASAGEDTTVRLWDARTGKHLHTLRGHIGMVGSLAFSPDSKLLVSGSRDHTVKVWDLTRLAKGAP